MANDVALIAPRPILAAQTLGAGVTITAPRPSLSATKTLPEVLNSISITAPAPSLVSTGLTSAVITFNQTAPTPTLSIGTKDFVQSAPTPTLSATLLSGGVITVVAKAATPIVNGLIDNPTIITASNTASTPRLSAALLAGQVATAALAAASPSLTAQIFTGEVITASLTAATPIMAAAGYPAYTITFAGSAPTPYLSSLLSGPASANYHTWCLNTRKSAITEYDNFDFNSYTVFQGKVIAANANGLVELGLQDNDAGTAIDAVMTTGQESFASSLHKRVPRIYVGYSTDGDMRFSTITVEGGTRTYALDYNGVVGTQQRRIGVGKGPRSRFWQFSVANVNGADFEINDLNVFVTKIKRRVA